MIPALKKAAVNAIRDSALVYPLLLILALYVFDLSPYLVAALTGISLLGGGIAGYRLRTESAYGVSMTVPMVSTLLLMVGGWIDWRGLLLFVLLGLAAARGVRQSGRASGNRKHTVAVCCWLAAGAFVYAWARHESPLSPYAFSIYIACTMMLMGLFVRWNDRRVREAMGVYGDEELPMNRLQRINRAFMTGFVLLVVLIGGATQLSVVLEWLLHFWRLLWSGSTEAPVLDTSAPSSNGLPGYQEVISDEDPEEYEESAWIRWAVWVVAGVISASIGVMVFVVLRWAYALVSQWLPGWLKRLLANLSIAARPLQEPEQIAYADTTEKLEPRKRFGNKSRLQVSEPPSGPRREYFRLVRDAVRRGYVFRPWKTPTETGREIEALSFSRGEGSEPVESVVERYNRSRYTEDPRQSSTD